jgi:hypothetical protein
MSVTIKSRTIAIIIAIAVLAIFLLGWGIGRKNRNNVSDRLTDSLYKQIEYLTIQIKEKDLYVAKVNQEVLSQAQAIADGDIARAELKALNLQKVSEITRLKGQVKILIDSIAHNGNVVIIKDCDSTKVEGKPAIELPFAFEKIDKFYSVNGSFDRKGKMSLSLGVPMEVSVITGWDKQAKQYKAAVIINNPYVFHNGVSSVKVGTTKPKKIGIGLQAGYGLVMTNGQASLGWYAGGGFSYNIARF